MGVLQKHSVASLRARLIAAVLAGSSLVGAAWLVAKAPSAGAQGDSNKASTHGALSMAEQQKRLDLLSPSERVERPRGVAPALFEILVPKDNPGNEAQVALGRKLFFDQRLSRDGTVACATCHDVSRGFSDRRPLSEGVGDQIGRRNAPTVLNALFFETQFWDGRALSLEDQAQLPITNPVEMALPNGEAAVAAIKDDLDYQKAFQDAYQRPVNFEDMARAIGAFERTLVFLNAPFDRFLAGDANAINGDARAGWALFLGKARCTACHQISNANPIGTDNRFHNIGVSARHQDFEGLAKKALAALAEESSQEKIDELALQTDLSELGRFTVTRNRSDIGAFKTEQLRNVGLTAPYMHDGSLATLWDVMDHYNKGGEANPFLDGGIEPLALTEREIDQLVAFMFSLTDDRMREQNQAEMTRQRQLAQGKRPFRDEALAMRKVLPFERALKGKAK